jgi:hypothetical protein
VIFHGAKVRHIGEGVHGAGDVPRLLIAVSGDREHATFREVLVCREDAEIDQWLDKGGKSLLPGRKGIG